MARVINTTTGAVQTHGDGRPLGVINTSRVVEEDLESLDSNEVLHVIPGHPWVAVFEDGTEIPLVAWAITESDRGHGGVVVAAENGSGPRVDVSESVEDRPGFVGYEQRR